MAMMSPERFDDEFSLMSSPLVHFPAHITFPYATLYSASWISESFNDLIDKYFFRLANSTLLM